MPSEMLSLTGASFLSCAEFLFLTEVSKPIEIGIIFAPLNTQSGADRF